MIEIGDVDQHTEQGTDGTDHRALDKLRQLLVTDGHDEPGDDHEEDDEEIVVGHLHVVGIDLKGGEDGRDDQAPQIFAAVAQHNAGDHRRQIGQRHDLPDMACGNDDEEIAGESPKDGAQHSEILFEVEGAQQDVEAQEIGKDIPHVFRQPQVVGILHLAQDIGRGIGRRDLIGGHTAEGGIGPAGALAGLFEIELALLTESATCRGVFAVEDSAVDVSRHEVDKTDDGKEDDGQDIRQPFLQCFHNIIFYKRLYSMGKVTYFFADS